MGVGCVQVDLTMRLSHSGEAYFTDPAAAEEGPVSPSKKNGTDEDVFSDPVGTNGYSSGEGESSGDAGEAGRRRRKARSVGDAAAEGEGRADRGRTAGEGGERGQGDKVRASVFALLDKCKEEGREEQTQERTNDE